MQNERYIYIIQGMKTRWITDNLRNRIETVPAVALLGARQVGKTTLAKTIAEDLDSIYLDLESLEDLQKLDDAIGFLRSHADKLVILDEIQRVPELFATLRGLIDANRLQGRTAGQYLFLGSASMDLLRQSSESLAGRISYIELSGFNVFEIDDGISNLQKLWLNGGFPNSYLAAGDDASSDWLEDLIRTYLERDIPQFGFRIPAARLRRLWTMLAHLQGENVNFSKLADNLEVTRPTVNSYVDVLIGLFLVRRLQPLHANVNKRLVKSPRYYIRDSGILHRLLGIDTFNQLLSNPILGKSWEGFVIENIHSVLPRRAETYFYRTAAGAEIDLIIKLPSSRIWAVEIKYGVAPKISKHFNQACDDAGATEKFVVYGGDDEFSIRNEITVLSLPRLMQKLEA